MDTNHLNNAAIFTNDSRRLCRLIHCGRMQPMIQVALPNVHQNEKM